MQFSVFSFQFSVRAGATRSVEVGGLALCGLLTLFLACSGPRPQPLDEALAQTRADVDGRRGCLRLESPAEASPWYALPSGGWPSDDPNPPALGWYWLDSPGPGCVALRSADAAPPASGLQAPERGAEPTDKRVAWLGSALGPGDRARLDRGSEAGLLPGEVYGVETTGARAYLRVLTVEAETATVELWRGPELAAGSAAVWLGTVPTRPLSVVLSAPAERQAELHEQVEALRAQSSLGELELALADPLPGDCVAGRSLEAQLSAAPGTLLVWLAADGGRMGFAIAGQDPGFVQAADAVGCVDATEPEPLRAAMLAAAGRWRELLWSTSQPDDETPVQPNQPWLAWAARELGQASRALELAAATPAFAAQLAWELGDFEGAKKWLEGRPECAESALLRGLLELTEGDTEEARAALATLTQGSASEQAFASLWLELVDQFTAEGDPASVLEPAAADPLLATASLAQARVLVADWLTQRGDGEGAQAQLELAIEAGLAVRDEGLVAELLARQAEALLATGRLAEALASAAEAGQQFELVGSFGNAAAVWLWAALLVHEHAALALPAASDATRARLLGELLASARTAAARDGDARASSAVWALAGKVLAEDYGDADGAVEAAAAALLWARLSLEPLLVAQRELELAQALDQRGDEASLVQAHVERAAAFARAGGDAELARKLEGAATP